jgi:hypothetical protein
VRGMSKRSRSHARAVGQLALGRLLQDAHRFRRAKAARESGRFAILMAQP